jgi:hypothetical protein
MLCALLWCWADALLPVLSFCLRSSLHPGPSLDLDGKGRRGMRGPDLFCGVVPSGVFMSMTRVLKLDGTGCDVLLKVSEGVSCH